MKKLLNAFLLARVQYIPIIIFPIVIGSVFAAGSSAFFQHNFWICLVGAIFAHLGANSANDYFDWVRGTDKYCREFFPELDNELICGSNILAENKMTQKEALVTTLSFFAIAFFCALYLIFTIGWFVLVFALAGFFLGFFYCCSLIGYGYIGRGLGELGIFLAFGPLPVIGSYYVMGGKDFISALYASIPFGLIAVMIVFHNHFSHVEADRKAGKNSPPVVIGCEKSRFIAKILVSVSALSIVLFSIIGIYPIYSLTASLPYFVLLVLPWNNNIQGDILRMKQVSGLSLFGGFLIMLFIIFS